MSRTAITLISLAFATFIGFAFYIFFDLRPRDLVDQVCSLAANQFKMDCSILAAPEVYEKGAVVNRLDRTAVNSKIGFPNFQIFGDSCLLGASATDFAISKVQPGQSIAFGEHEIAIDRTLSVGAKVSTPEAANFDLEVTAARAEAAYIPVWSRNRSLGSRPQVWTYTETPHQRRQAFKRRNAREARPRQRQPQHSFRDRNDRIRNGQAFYVLLLERLSLARSY